MSKKVFQKIAGGLIAVALLSVTNLTVFAQETRPPIPTVEYFIVETKVLDDGTSIDEVVINGPPTPPVGYERTTVELPEPNPEAGLVTLSVPAYNWSFGCSTTSASMIAAFYDRGFYPGMYTGPTNNGTMPMDNSTWGDVTIAGESRHQCPLSATRNGLDERTIRGHVDDYWIQSGASGPDPYDGNWTEHALGDCTGDYMKTNKWFAIKNFNTDGGTTFYYYPSGAPTTAANLESDGLYIYDGGYGLKLFYESRGETVDAMYNQYIYGYKGNTQGFTYNQYKTEIDAGRPVMIHLTGHTMVGIGYDDTSDELIYINDTWDYSTHTMTWGGIYEEMEHIGVTIVRLGDPTLVNLARFDATPKGSAVHVEWETAAEIDNAGFHLWRNETEDGEYIRITDHLIDAQGGATFGIIYSYEDYDVISGKTYYYKLEDIDYGGVSTFHGPVSATAGNAAVVMLITPEDGAGVPAYPPITFEWESESLDMFKLQFSIDPDFSSRIKTLPGKNRGDGFINDEYYTPDRREWRAIRRLGRKGKTVYWRVYGEDGQEISTTSKPYGFKVRSRNNLKLITKTRRYENTKQKSETQVGASNRRLLFRDSSFFLR